MWGPPLRGKFYKINWLSLPLVGKSTGISYITATLAGVVVIIWVSVTVPHSYIVFSVTVNMYSCTFVQLYSCADVHVYSCTHVLQLYSCTAHDKRLDTVISCP